jgi:hypothetical protein
MAWRSNSRLNRGIVNMATAVPVYEDRRMSVGRVFQRAFSAITLNPAVVLGLALCVGALPALLMTYLFIQSGMTMTPGVAPSAASFNKLLGATFISTVVSFVIAALVQGALTRATVSANEGKRATFGESLSTAVRVVLPLIGLSILFAIGIGIGFILLLIPGIILMLMWSVAVPALVIERQGVFAAFSRSAELTKGAKWKILGLFLVIGVCYWLLSYVAGLVGFGTYNSATATAGGLTTGNLIGGIVVGTVFNALWGTIQPSLYVELRQWKEGDSIGNLEQVFA